MDNEVEMMNVDECNEKSNKKDANSGSEDGEISDSDSEDNFRIKDSRQKNDQAFSIEGKDSTKHSIFDDLVLAKMGERASRFGLDKESDEFTLESELNSLYSSLSIITEEDLRHARLDTIHVHGIEKMTTNDIFEYFFSHKPIFVEWVSSNSCNVVWKDDISAARAMIFYSKLIKYNDQQESRDADMETNDIETEEASKNWGVSLKELLMPPPAGRWRAGAPHPKSESIFLRFANRSDKKVSGNEKLKVLTNKFNGAEVDSKTGILSESLKSKIQRIENAYSDTEEKSKNPWGELCETWGVYDSQEVFGVEGKQITAERLAPLLVRRSPNIRDRIGAGRPPRSRMPVTQRLSVPAREQSDISRRLGKRVNVEHIDITEDSESENSASSDEEWTTKSKVPRMRMHADDEVEKLQMSKKTKVTKTWEEDEISNITVEVKNEYTPPPKTAGVRGRLGDLSHFNRNTPVKSTNDVRSRLGQRNDSFDSESDDDDSDRGTRSSTVNKVQPSSRRKPAVASTVWSRLDKTRNRAKNDDDSCSDSDDNAFRSALTHTASQSSRRPGFEKTDVRSRLGKKTSLQRSPLRIEVDNELFLEN